MGLFDPKADSTFVQIDIKYADRPGMYMNKEAYASFTNMWEHAKKDGVNLIIRSAARNFDYQKGIWERKWLGQTILSDGTNASEIDSLTLRALKILQYSSMPGTSRHHWGTDIDLNSFENSWFDSGEGLTLFTWLENNASAYGFCRPYTKKDAERPNGYNEEKWHWSYLPLASSYTSFAERHVKNSDIKGFNGASVAEQIKVVENYILGIDSKCKH